jgi:hypothetical protein
MVGSLCCCWAVVRQNHSVRVFWKDVMEQSYSFHGNQEAERVRIKGAGDKISSSKSYPQ